MLLSFSKLLKILWLFHMTIILCNKPCVSRNGNDIFAQLLKLRCYLEMSHHSRHTHTTSCPQKMQFYQLLPLCLCVCLWALNWFREIDLPSQRCVQSYLTNDYWPDSGKDPMNLVSMMKTGPRWRTQYHIISLGAWGFMISSTLQSKSVGSNS